jgi:hypothetical protein
LLKPDGIMESWSNGIMGLKEFLTIKMGSFHSNPTFLPSETFFYFTGANIPAFHVSGINQDLLKDH